MITNRNKYFWTTLITFLVISCSSLHANWQTVSYKGKKYISLQQIKTSFGFTNYKISGSSHTLTKKGLSLQLNSGSQKCILNTVKFEFSYPAVKRGTSLLVSETDVNKIITPVLRPTIIKNAKSFRTVVIDPGHGGKDAGAVNRYGTEAGYNLKVGLKLKKLLTAQGFNVVMTRENNTYLSLQQRVSLANRYGNAIFISIHFNASSRTAARGLETFTLSPVGVAHYGRGVKSSDYRVLNGNHQDSANIALATAIHGRMLERTRSVKVPDRGIKRARFSVLTKIKHPAILIEGGFMSNPTEAILIEKKIYQNTVATAICEGVIRYRKALNASSSSARKSTKPERLDY